MDNSFEPGIVSRSEFVSFIWRAHPMARGGRGGSILWGHPDAMRHSAQAAMRSPLLAAANEMTELSPPQGQLRFLHQCFGIAGESVAVLATWATIFVWATAQSDSSRGDFPDRTPQIQQGSNPNRPATGSDQETLEPIIYSNTVPRIKLPTFPNQRVPGIGAEPEKKAP
jgi:hypothetical protein